VGIAVVALGVGAFAVGRLVVGGPAPAPATAGWVLANVFAAVAEEAWFRRLCFGALRPGGTGYAVVASAGLFAVVHVGQYGLWVLPLDLAAGLLLGWQRAATGRWWPSAVTHAAANVLMIL
jgi:membrane protease YdiL (CAAX protease family)